MTRLIMPAEGNPGPVAVRGPDSRQPPEHIASGCLGQVHCRHQHQHRAVPGTAVLCTWRGRWAAAVQPGCAHAWRWGRPLHMPLHMFPRLPCELLPWLPGGVRVCVGVCRRVHVGVHAVSYSM